jgi:hypothetical protein
MSYPVYYEFANLYEFLVEKTMKQQRAEIWPEALPRQHGPQLVLDQMARPRGSIRNAHGAVTAPWPAVAARLPQAHRWPQPMKVFTAATSAARQWRWTRWLGWRLTKARCWQQGGVEAEAAALDDGCELRWTMATGSYSIRGAERKWDAAEKWTESRGRWSSPKGGNGGGVATESGGVTGAPVCQHGWEVEERKVVWFVQTFGRKLAWGEWVRPRQQYRWWFTKFDLKSKFKRIQFKFKSCQTWTDLKGTFTSKKILKQNMVVKDLNKGTTFSIGMSSYSKWILN